MIYIVSQENAHLYGDAIPSMYRLRYRAFIARQNYNVSSVRNMEYDFYDTPAAYYAIWKDAAGLVRGCTRLAPTERPFMIRELWPELVTADALNGSPVIWEASRFCIDKELSPELRKQVHGELACAMQEFGLQHKLEAFIGVMQPRIWRLVFINIGWQIEFFANTNSSASVKRSWRGECLSQRASSTTCAGTARSRNP